MFTVPGFPPMNVEYGPHTLKIEVPNDYNWLARHDPRGEIFEAMKYLLEVIERTPKNV